MEEEKLLQVGDYIIEETRWGNSIYKIHRVTKTRAYTAKGMCFSREISESCGEKVVKPYPKDTGWDRPSYYFGTPEKIQEYKHYEERIGMINKTEEIDFAKLTNEQLKQVIGLIDSFKEDEGNNGT